jgi:hypothetical protein
VAWPNTPHPCTPRRAARARRRDLESNIIILFIEINKENILEGDQLGRLTDLLAGTIMANVVVYILYTLIYHSQWRGPTSSHPMPRLYILSQSRIRSRISRAWLIMAWWSHEPAVVGFLFRQVGEIYRPSSSCFVGVTHATLLVLTATLQHLLCPASLPKLVW